MVGIPGQCLCAEAESVVKDNRGMACDIARFNGDHVVFWTSQRFAHCIALQRYDKGDNENASKVEFDCKSPAVVDGKGRFWMRAKPLYRRRSGRDPGYGIFEYSNDHWFHHTTKTTGLKHDRIHDMAVDREGHPWAATYRSVSQYRYGQWHNYGREDGLSNERVYHIARDKNGDLWCTHGGHGNISVFNGKTWRVINKNSGLLEKVHTVFCARDGARWFGVHYDDIDPGQSGLVRFDGQSWLSFAKRDGLPGNRIWEISELPDGKLLLRIRNPTLAVFESDTTPLQISDQALVVFEPDTTRWARVSGYVENRDGNSYRSRCCVSHNTQRACKSEYCNQCAGFLRNEGLARRIQDSSARCLGWRTRHSRSPWRDCQWRGYSSLLVY